ncbi:MAG TPA: sigma-E factor negative regulatory protein [Usitatibacter sp.]|jgi:sigma-E factor negative regulatory protein RseA|nr:sigma-E factor negative regulatory protein [Usitatibacter sp.]
MTHEISSLMDGELGPQEAGQALQACCGSEEHKRTWYLYHVIGDSMRGQAPRRLALPSGVLDSLKAQPTVLAPRRKLMDTTFARVSLAAAASVATVGVVGWMGTQGGQVADEGVVARNATGLQPVANTRTQPVLDVQDYLVAHRQIPSPELYRQVNNRAAARAR